MNKLAAMAVFVRVAEEGGFTPAAAKLGITVSAVTKAVSRLEDDLGVQLFTRTTRQINITDYARDYYDQCVSILADVEEAEAILQGDTTSAKGTVRALLPFSFGRVTVVPALPQFHKDHPEIKLELDFSDDAMDLVARGYDVAVRTGKINNSRLNMRVLTRSKQVTVAAPSYLAAHGTPMTPSDLAGHNCIVGRFGPDWPFRDENGEPIHVPVSGATVINSGDALREAAVAGLGIAQGTWWLFRKDLENGEVVSILEDYADVGLPVSILYTANRHVPRKVRAFLDFLIEISR